MNSESSGFCRKCGGAIPPHRLRCPSCHAFSSGGRKSAVLLVVAVIIVVAMAAYATSNRPVNGGTQLVENRTTGSGSNDFWKTYPSSRSDAGSPVTHPSWVTAALNAGPVLIFVHSTDCVACQLQAPIIASINTSHNGSMFLFDLLDGRDDTRMMQAFAAYDPTGGSYRIPLVVVVNQVRDAQGNKVIVWHSWEGVVEEKALNGWMNDAISHHTA